MTPSSEATAESASGQDAFSFQVPQVFHEIPLGLGVDEDTFDEQIRGFADGYWGRQEEREPLRKLFAAMYSVNSQQLAAQGAVYNALGIFPLGGTADGLRAPERVSRCTLMVSMRDLDNPDPGLAAAGIAEALARRGDGEAQHSAI